MGSCQILSAFLPHVCTPGPAPCVCTSGPKPCTPYLHPAPQDPRPTPHLCTLHPSSHTLHPMSSPCVCTPIPTPRTLSVYPVPHMCTPVPTPCAPCALQPFPTAGSSQPSQSTGQTLGVTTPNRATCPLYQGHKLVLESEGRLGSAQAAQSSCGCPIPGSVEGQVGWGLEQPGLVGDVPAQGRRLGLDDLQGPFQLKPFHDSMICGGWCHAAPQEQGGNLQGMPCQGLGYQQGWQELPTPLKAPTQKPVPGRGCFGSTPGFSRQGSRVGAGPQPRLPGDDALGFYISSADSKAALKPALPCQQTQGEKQPGFWITPGWREQV
ncbi:uncharacterized protein LOC127382792 [Apus apus]|uniref:uncharacterized protein LOC127382792 n=1 Tax=Apus apus TaxID=8895 RepID=UPI0021F8E028|nr:uncharacterized protein LOC127382792 [Apus apus]XP_051470796.1 uncharacterized protein LOC127382792 [Apus apus]XP_051470797.1 uncharacterized protein LOC127382792 [Apus apus]XP_051470798.1 uncharacterized protein LOC127382792 [Apus apus]XP_051470799.1 uncharacterized protein LOC127382792 [Apus apus]